MAVLSRSQPIRRTRLERKKRKRRKQILLLVAATSGAYALGFWLMGKIFHSSKYPEVGVDNVFMSQPRRRRPSHERIAPIVHSDATPYESPLLIFTCQRGNYLSQTLDDIYNYIPRPCSFGCPVVISQDGENDEVTRVILNYKEKFKSIGIPLLHIRHKQSSRRESEGVYGSLSKHYKWALSEFFDGNVVDDYPPPQRVVILEEDIHTSPDFFSYMEATSHILDEDSSLFAISAFNDNGHLVHDPTRVLRSDFFPGLGWMMTQTLWKRELESKWPEAYWDDWLREPAQRKGRQVIRPEISRTFHFGINGGASHNQFGSILEQVELNHESINWMEKDLSFLKESNYDVQYINQIESSIVASNLMEAKHLLRTGNDNVVLQYLDFEDFQQIAEKIQIMDDEKAMVPRTAYKGIIETRPFGSTNNLLFLKPVNGATY
jgi:alpha-1,3-mannosyl-glycoprotein beta-1,2-N-acetylglucosaminyltransferase